MKKNKDGDEKPKIENLYISHAMQRQIDIINFYLAICVIIINKTYIL